MSKQEKNQKNINYSQDFVIAMVANVSPSWEKIAPNKFNSSEDLSFAIRQATDVIKLASSQDFNTNTSIYNMKKKSNSE